LIDQSKSVCAYHNSGESFMISLISEAGANPATLQGPTIFGKRPSDDGPKGKKHIPVGTQVDQSLVCINCEKSRETP